MDLVRGAEDNDSTKLGLGKHLHQVMGVSVWRDMSKCSTGNSNAYDGEPCFLRDS